MLHILRASDAVSAWGETGWPALLAKAKDRVEPAWLYWALIELTEATRCGDLPAIDDLLSEVAVLLERLWSNIAPVEHFIPVSSSLWGEIQRGRGGEDFEYIALHARLLRNTISPSWLGPRPSDAVPAYRAIADTIRSGQLPLLTETTRLDAKDLGKSSPAVGFLQLLLAVLCNRGGHLVDAGGAEGPPAGANPARTGWHPHPTGRVVGSLDATDSAREPVLLLRPRAAVDAVSDAVPAYAGRLAPGLTTESVGRALADAWLIDTTLEVGDELLRRRTVNARLQDHLDEEPLWRVSLAVFHPHQFFAVAPGDMKQSGHLRVVRPVTER